MRTLYGYMTANSATYRAPNISTPNQEIGARREGRGDARLTRRSSEVRNIVVLGNLFPINFQKHFAPIG